MLECEKNRRYWRKRFDIKQLIRKIYAGNGNEALMRMYTGNGKQFLNNLYYGWKLN